MHTDILIHLVSHACTHIRIPAFIHSPIHSFHSFSLFLLSCIHTHMHTYILVHLVSYACTHLRIPTFIHHSSISFYFSCFSFLFFFFYAYAHTCTHSHIYITLFLRFYSIYYPIVYVIF